jgi:tetratricopeptide (TPR) repeat protein
VKKVRAFLSHSSKDKDFVRSVANQLGRQFCVFDVFEFQTGEEFRISIRESLKKSSIFVLFASKNSINSAWVKFEENEAELLAIEGNIVRPLVFIIDENITHNDLPEWLKRSRIRTILSPKPVAREIIYHIQDMMREKQQPMFVGRRKEAALAEEKILKYDENGPRRFFLMFGLSGIGRRTLVKKISENLLSLKKVVIIRIQEGDDTRDIAIKIAEQVEMYADLEDLKRLVSEIEELQSVDVLKRIANNIQIMISNGELPVFFDAGGLVDNDGILADPINQVLDLLRISDDTYVAMVSNRKPYIALNDGNKSDLVPVIGVEPLSDQEISRLLGKIADSTKIEVTQDQLVELSSYVRGYPPAAHFCMEMVREYGIEAVLANKYPLVEFRTSHFLTYISQENVLHGEKYTILSILSYYSPVPLSVIGKVLEVDAEELQHHLAYLIDTAIVIPDVKGLYRMSEPVVDAVQRFIEIKSVPHDRVAEALKEYLSDEVENKGLLDLSRNLFKARRFSGQVEADESEISLISDLISLEIEFYHARDFENAVKMGKLAVEQRPNNNESRSFLVRALAQLGKYDEAETHIQYLRDCRHLKDAYFLKGFVERLKGNDEYAIEAYKKAITLGRKGLAVHREIANCYFQIGKLEEARKHIDIAQTLDPYNKYIVDLQIIIAIRQRDEKTAREKLRILKDIDKPEFFEHRSSTIEYVFGSKENSYNSAKSAINGTARPTFAMLSQFIKSAIYVGKIDEASDALRQMEHRFKNFRIDHQIILRCRLENSIGEFRNAIALLDKLTKEEPIQKLILRDAISGILENQLWLSDEEKEKLKSELQSLKNELYEDDHYLIIDAELNW